MIRINLLPHREERRKQRQKDFVAMLLLSAILGALVAIGVATYFSSQLSEQEQRNNFIKTENARLDTEIKEVANLKQEIEALKARQQAVEDLQSDRNQPIYLMDELAQQVPEGVYLKSIKQDAQRVSLSGYAQSNERVSELLRNLGSNSPWLERPDLVEIRSVSLSQGKDAKRVFEFSINAGIKRPRDNDPSAVDAKGPVPNATPSKP